MKRILSTLLFFCTIISLNAQQKKLITEIKSTHTNEVIQFKYNSKNQLTYFDEKGVITYREFTLKYDKKTDILTECIINQDRGEFMSNSKYNYENPEYIIQETKTGGKKNSIKTTENSKIFIDNEGRLEKTILDGKPWEVFSYDERDNLIKYTVYSASEKMDQDSEYTFDSKKSILSNMENLPNWFWTLHMNNMKWCSEFIGENNAIENTTEFAKFSATTIEITYDYDGDGYPVKQYYDGKLVKEFKYKTID